jgi:predicted nucleotidyltransferase
MMVPKYKLFLDMDGVICDWEKQFKRYSGGVPVETYDVEHGKKNRYFFVRKNSPEFYATMPWLKDGEMLYNFVKNFPTEILSHAPDKLAVEGKQIWLKNNNINLKANLVPHSSDKAKYATVDSILIDDREDLIAQFVQAGGQGICHKNAIDTINKLKELFNIKESHRIYNSILNPYIWDTDETIKPEFLDSLTAIANAFYKDSDLNVPLEDVYFLGSSAGYNWTPTSDIDLHLVIDFSKIDENKELVKKYVDVLKSKWNDNHHIKIGNHPVEVYIQDINEVNKSQAVYSILKNQWIKKPNKENVQIDKECIKKKYKEMVDRINISIKEQDLDNLKRLIKRIYEIRQSGLDSSGEYSVENITFKLLRSTGYINRIRDAITTLTDKNLSAKFKK